MTKKIATCIAEAQNFQTYYYDQKHKQIQYRVENEIMLRTLKLRTKKLNKKLDTRLHKSFEIAKVIDTQIYKLKLSRAYKVHSIFYINLLKLHRSNTIKDRIESFSSSIEIIIENDKEYEK